MKWFRNNHQFHLVITHRNPAARRPGNLTRKGVRDRRLRFGAVIIVAMFIGFFAAAAMSAALN